MGINAAFPITEPETSFTAPFPIEEPTMSLNVAAQVAKRTTTACTAATASEPASMGYGAASPNEPTNMSYVARTPDDPASMTFNSTVPNDIDTAYIAGPAPDPVAYSASTPKKVDGTVLTYVVPAPKGCNMACPFCFIRQRQEPATATDLRPRDMVEFAERIPKIGWISIQGYEPLLPESRLWTRAILKYAQENGIRTALITNGWHLADRAAWLNELGLTTLYVSIDSGDPAEHDWLRRTPGAFKRAFQGLEVAARMDYKLAVHSCLIPRRRDRLATLAPQLKHAGVDEWHVSPLQKVRDADKASGVCAKLDDIYDDMNHLGQAAFEVGMKFVVDDEFSRLPSPDNKGTGGIAAQRLANPHGVVRLVPTGHVAWGFDIIAKHQENAPLWRPGQPVPMPATVEAA